MPPALEESGRIIEHDYGLLKLSRIILERTTQGHESSLLFYSFAINITTVIVPTKYHRDIMDELAQART